MKELSDWQQARVRDALRAYHRYERGIEGEYFTWKDVREAIAEYTDVGIGTSAKNGAERLRQFVEGIEDSNPRNSRKFPAPKPAALAAIVAFVTHEDLNLLTEDELREYMPGFQAPLRLLEYLEQKFETERSMPSDVLEGKFHVEKTDESNLIIRTLTLQRASQEGLVQVIETEEFYDRETGPVFKLFLPDQLRTKCTIRNQYGGWAILTPEYNLLFFMKEEHSGMNHYYFTLFSDMTRKRDKPINRLVLIQHDYPFEPEKNRNQNMDEIINSLTEELSNNLLAFRRY